MARTDIENSCHFIVKSFPSLLLVYQCKKFRGVFFENATIDLCYDPQKLYGINKSKE